MSIGPISASNFYQSPVESLFSNSQKAQKPFTLPEDTPLPGQGTSAAPQGVQTPIFQDSPLRNILTGHGEAALQATPLFNVLAGGEDPLMQAQPEFNVLAQNQALLLPSD